VARWQLVYFKRTVWQGKRPQLILELAGRKWLKSCSHDTGPMQIAWSRRNLCKLVGKVTAAIAFWCGGNGENWGMRKGLKPFASTCRFGQNSSFTAHTLKRTVRTLGHLARWHWLWFWPGFPYFPHFPCFPIAGLSSSQTWGVNRFTWRMGLLVEQCTCTPCHV